MLLGSSPIWPTLFRLPVIVTVRTFYALCIYQYLGPHWSRRTDEHASMPLSGMGYRIPDRIVLSQVSQGSDGTLTIPRDDNNNPPIFEYHIDFERQKSNYTYGQGLHYLDDVLLMPKNNYPGSSSPYDRDRIQIIADHMASAPFYTETMADGSHLTTMTISTFMALFEVYQKNLRECPRIDKISRYPIVGTITEQLRGRLPPPDGYYQGQNSAFDRALAARQLEMFPLDTQYDPTFSLDLQSKLKLALRRLNTVSSRAAQYEGASEEKPGSDEVFPLTEPSSLMSERSMTPPLAFDTEEFARARSRQNPLDWGSGVPLLPGAVPDQSDGALEFKPSMPTTSWR